MGGCVVQRIIEVLQSIPSIPLWMALAAILPVTWSPILIYFGITVILGLLDWTGLARAVRSKLLSLREEDYVLAAQLMGAKPPRIIVRHLIPGFMSHLIASATITIPAMILGETSLSFLGLGLRPPVTSWGVLLNEAQNINVVVLYPWLILPVVPVILVILASISWAMDCVTLQIPITKAAVVIKCKYAHFRWSTGKTSGRKRLRKVTLTALLP